ncbi:MAG: hypothetical protein ABR878_03985 [Roseiarcus sp.]|jgi:hypothetical protein
MARGRVQVQTGLGGAGFDEIYGSEERCHAALVEWRRPGGFACPDCDGGDDGKPGQIILRPAKAFSKSAIRKLATGALRTAPAPYRL